MTGKPFKGSGHLVIAGNSPFLPAIFEELSRSGIPANTAVVLCSNNSLPSAQEKSFPARIVHLQGPAETPEVLERASPGTAHAILVATYGEPEADRKADTLCRSLVHQFGVSPDTITVPVSDEEAGAVIRSGVDRAIKTVPVHTLLVRIIAQSARQKHLSEVYGEIFSYHGNEFYTVPGTDTGGNSFARCLRLYANACAVGIRNRETLRLNPPMQTIVESEDSLVVLAPSMKAIRKNDILLPAPDNTVISGTTPGAMPFESFLFLGWNSLCPEILAELDRYVPTGSRAECITPFPPEFPASIPEMNTLAVHYRSGDIHDRGFLSELPWEHYEYIVIPGNRIGEVDETHAIRQTLEQVLAERGFANHITSVHWFPQKDPATVLPSGTILVSCILRMAAQELFHHEFSRVVDELTTDKGAEIYLKPAENYIALDKSADFYTILESARRKNETAIGYIQNGTVVLNPEKASRVRFYHFDKIVVLSDENC